ncbi:hypothetical protein MCUN1_003579 [Malassezia cuniculi]|uniref:DUF202 domain-containing protein n=1 Tax=Malassezia cuniculi TaxID=948313 RepID=A0AAF0EXT7_9BASI|nr:hypothetical protein MCUN1_003579 [Malassezia cuniculi]
MASLISRGEEILTSAYNTVAKAINRGTAAVAEEARPLLHGQSSSDSYGAVPENAIPVPKPRKVVTPVKVEAKVWFANERTWISWLRASVLIGTLSLALFNSSSYFEPSEGNPGNPGMAKVVRNFGIIYSVIAAAVLLWGLYSYQRRVTLIKSRWAGSFDDLIGPPVVCVACFIAVLANYIIALKQHY